MMVFLLLTLIVVVYCWNFKFSKEKTNDITLCVEGTFLAPERTPWYRCMKKRFWKARIKHFGAMESKDKDISNKLSKYLVTVSKQLKTMIKGNAIVHVQSCYHSPRSYYLFLAFFYIFLENLFCLPNSFTERISKMKR